MDSRRIVSTVCWGTLGEVSPSASLSHFSSTDISWSHFNVFDWKFVNSTRTCSYRSASTMVPVDLFLPYLWPDLSDKFGFWNFLRINDSYLSRNFIFRTFLRYALLDFNTSWHEFSILVHCSYRACSTLAPLTNFGKVVAHILVIHLVSQFSQDMLYREVALIVS